MQDAVSIVCTGSGLMVFLTTFSIGILVTQMRSVASCIAGAILIAAMFAAAAIVSGNVSFWALGLSILGYNAALGTHLVVSVLLETGRAQKA